ARDTPGPPGREIVASPLPPKYDRSCCSRGQRLSIMQTACPSFFWNPAVRRRDFLQAGALSLFGLGLPEVLRAAPTAGKRRAKACILLFMWGGPAQQDTWDMKPEAPVDYRGEFQPIATTVPGLRI